MRSTTAVRIWQCLFSCSSSSSLSGELPPLLAVLVLNPSDWTPRSLVVGSGYGVVHLSLVLGRQLRLAEVECQLVDGSGKAEGTIIGKVHWRTRVESDVKALVGRHEKRN